MNIYGLTSILIVLVILFYTIGLAIQYWNQQLRAGAVFTLLIVILITWSMYYVIFRVD